jgi:hypothetical protein
MKFLKDINDTASVTIILIIGFFFFIYFLGHAIGEAYYNFTHN